MRRRDLRPLAGALDTVRERAQPASLLAAVQCEWDATAGELLAEHATPVSERAGTVTIACSSSIWAQELSMLADDLRTRLNARLERTGGGPTVGALRFVTGPLDRMA